MRLIDLAEVAAVIERELIGNLGHAEFGFGEQLCRLAYSSACDIIVKRKTGIAVNYPVYIAWVV